VTPLEGPLGDAAAAALQGDLIVFPTDTVYGLGTRPDDPAATARVFEAKRRPRDLELPVLVAELEAARDVAVLDDRADVLARAYWPGPLTLVLRRSSGSSSWDLGGDPATIGVRSPRHALALRLLGETGPLAVTSANRSGEPPARSCEELHAVFGDDVAIYLCQDEPLGGVASTVVDLCSGWARIVRAGSITGQDLAELLPDEVALLDSRPSS
jgi:L-threonylcarbamoyladenylate synthase